MVIDQQGSKSFTLYTDLPNGTYPYNEGNLTLKTEISGDWKSYLENNFKNIPVEVITIER